MTGTLKPQDAKRSNKIAKLTGTLKPQDAKRSNKIALRAQLLRTSLNISADVEGHATCPLAKHIWKTLDVKVLPCDVVAREPRVVTVAGLGIGKVDVNRFECSSEMLRVFQRVGLAIFQSLRVAGAALAAIAVRSELNCGLGEALQLTESNLVVVGWLPHHLRDPRLV